MKVEVPPDLVRSLEIERKVLNSLETTPRANLAELTEAIQAGLAFDARYTGRPLETMDPQAVKAAVATLQAHGKVERWEHRHRTSCYRVTAYGKAYVVLHWRERLHHARAGVANLRRLAAELASVIPLAGQPVETLDIAYVGLTPRTTKLLTVAGINTVGCLAGWTKEELLGLRGVGTKSVDEIEWELASMGLEIGSLGGQKKEPDHLYHVSHRCPLHH